MNLAAVTHIEDKIAEGGLGKLIKLPFKCRNSHYYVVGDDYENVLPVKLNIACSTATRGRKFSGLELPFTSLMLLWVPEETESRFALITPGNIKIKKATMSAVQNHCPAQVYNKSKLVSKLHRIYEERNLLFDLQALQNITKREQMTREQWKTLPSPHGTENMSVKELSEIIGQSKFHVTLPSLKADAFFDIQSNDKVLPLQIKSSHRNKGKTYTFSACSGYKMLLLCRPLVDETIGTLVIPGDLAKKGIHFRETSPTYNPYVIKDSQLRTFLTDLSLAVANGKQALKWPSGKEVFISGLKLQTLDEINQSTSAEYRTEHRNQRRREQLLPDLRFIEPAIQNTTVDKLVETLRVQDKTGEKTAGEAFNVTLKKNAGKVNGKRTYQPYHETDFDILWVFIPGDRYQCIIPVYELVKRGKLQTSTIKGSQNVMIHLIDSSSCRGDQWTRNFCFDTQAEDFQNRVKGHLEEINTRVK